MQIPPKISLFAKSAAHQGLLLAALIGFLCTPNVAIATIVAAGIYALGWVFLPDLPFIKKAVEQKRIQQELNALDDAFSNSQEQQTPFAAACAKLFREIKNTTSFPAVQLSVGQQLRDLHQQYQQLHHNQNQLMRIIRSGVRKELTAKLLETRQSLAQIDERSRLYLVTKETLEKLEKQEAYHKLIDENLQLIGAEITRVEESLNLFTMEVKQNHTLESLAAGIDSTLSNLATTNESLAQINSLTSSMPGLPKLELQTSRALQS